ncbi:MAG: LTA synthase family protein [Deltaproteobacteria bacterium]
MKKFLIFTGSIIFWYLFFVVSRILFLLANYHYTADLSVEEIVLTFIHGFKLDISFVSYLSVITSVLFAFFFFLDGKLLYKLIFIYFSVITFILSFIILSDSALYSYWGFRLDATPLIYLKNPKEVLASTSYYFLFLMIIIYACFVLFTLFVFNKMFKGRFLTLNKGNILEIPFYILLIVALAIPIRGGLGLAPLNAGNAYFSHKPFANHAAINAAWNLSKSLLDLSDPDPFLNYTERENAEKIFSGINRENEEFTRLLITTRPNILILVLEGVPERLIDTTINGITICPELNDLKRKSIYFDRFFANGDRSEKGLASIFSGYPNLAHTSVMKYPEKTQKLGYLSKELKKNKYNEMSFYYGGNIDFANMRSYFFNGSFDKLIDMTYFDRKNYNSKWGAHDEFVLDKWSDDIQKFRRPFFSACFTLSSHEPFEIPEKPAFKAENDNSKFLSSVHYTDKCVGNFIKQAQKTSWWDSTLIIIVSDHGHRLPDDIPYHSNEKFHIPMFWTGGAISFKDTIISSTLSQIDIIPSLLRQMDIKSDNFRFGSDFSGKNSGSKAMYCFNLGFGYVGDDFSFIYDVKGRQAIEEKGNLTDNTKKEAFALYDVIHYDFKEK